MMRYEEENERLADQSPCANIRADLKMCLLESDCCKKVSYLHNNITRALHFISSFNGLTLLATQNS